jgi:hypothetical protein
MTNQRRATYSWPTWLIRGWPSHCYKGRSLLFDHGDLELEGETRLEMTGSMSSIQIRSWSKKLKIKFCMWFQAKLLSFYSNLCRTYEISPNPPWVETQKNLIIKFSLVWLRISTLLVEPVPTPIVCLSCHGTKYSKSRREVTSWLGWPVTIRVAH